MLDNVVHNSSNQVTNKQTAVPKAQKPCTIILVDDDKDDRYFAQKTFESSSLVKNFIALKDGKDLILYMKENGCYDHTLMLYDPLLIVLDLHLVQTRAL